MISFEAAKLINEAEESRNRRSMKRRRVASEGEILKKGAPLNLNPRSKEVKELTKKAVMDYNEKCPDTHYFFPIVVINATKQLMNGLLFKIEIMVGKSPKIKRNVSPARFYSKNHHAEVSEFERRVVHATISCKDWNGFEEVVISTMS